MKFEDIANIWSVDLSTLSNAARGQVYFARVKYLVDQFFVKPQISSEMINGNRFCRTHLRKAVGCRPAILSQNRRIKSLLARADERLTAQRALAALPKRGRRMRDLELSIEGLRARVDEQDRKLTELYEMLGGPAKPSPSDRALAPEVNKGNNSGRPR